MVRIYFRHMNSILQHFIEAQQLLSRVVLDDSFHIKVELAGKAMVAALSNKGKIMSCGNGGSMCDAMHFAEELSGRYRDDRPPIAALSISDPSHISCVGNDYGFDEVFARMIIGLGREGDILLCISTSGNSRNIIRAAEEARKSNIIVVGLTGKNGGELAGLCDIEIRVPWDGYADRIQEVHIKVIHSLIHYIEKHHIN